MWNKIFFKDFQTLSLEKKEMKKKEKKKKEEPNLFLIITYLFISPITQRTICSW